MVKLTLYQGDALKILPKLPDESVDTVITDPPYNIGKAKWDCVDLNFFRNWLKECKRVVKHTMVMFCSHIFVKDIRNICEDELSLTYKMMLIWDFRERTFTPQKNYKCGFDTILFFVKTNDYVFNRPYEYSKCWNILKFTRVQSNRKEGNKAEKKKYHLTQKPIDLMKHLIEIHSNEGDTILDPFLGSGTTMKACLELNRNCIGIECNPEFIKIVKKRLNWNSSLGDVLFEFYADRTKLETKNTNSE